MHTRLWWLYCVALFSYTLLLAQAPQLPNTQASPTLPNVVVSKKAVHGQPLTAEDLEAFLDGFMPLQIAEAGIPGVVIAVVKDGKLLFANGYGYADKEKKVLISPEKTLFRVGSITKLFTWTAVMQQVEQGKLDLDRDINDYLDFKIPPTFDKPITLRDLMTHRPGFEETYKNAFVNSPADFIPISEYMREHVPARIFPPGMIPAYSNYGSMLAGYIVERISGQNFDDYLEEHLLKPLDMNRSTFRQPLPEALKSSMSQGYSVGSSEPKPFELLQISFAGSLSTSAVDITHFMLMNLQNGRYGSRQILKPETIAQMHARQEGWPNIMNAMCLGFYEQSRNGYRVIAHAGMTHLFHSNLFLILDANVGFFVSYNSLGQQAESSFTLFNQFMDRYFPQVPQEEPKWLTKDEDASRVTGTYESSRRFETNVLAIIAMMGQNTVAFDSHDNLTMTSLKGLDQNLRHFREIAPMVFRDVNGKSKIAFVKDTHGNQTAYTDMPVVVFQQVNNVLDKQSMNYFIIGFSLSVIILTLIMWPITAMIRKHYAKPLVLESSSKWLRLIVRLVCLTIVAYTIGVMIFIGLLSNNVILTSQSELWLHVLQVIGIIACVGSLVVIYNSIKSWTNKQLWFWSKIWNTLLALACIGFSWFIIHWHLLNFDIK